MTDYCDKCTPIRDEALQLAKDAFDEVNAANADLRVRLQRAHGAFHALTTGDPQDVVRLVADAPRLLEETRPPGNAGVALLNELRELRGLAK